MIKEYIEELREEGYSWTTVAQKVKEKYDDGRSGNAWRKWYKRQGVEKGVVQVTTVTSQPKTPDELLVESGLNPEEWTYKDWTVKSWGNDNWSAGAKFTRKLASRNDLEEFIKAVENYRPSYEYPQKSTYKGECLFVPALFDAHIGKHSDGETNYRDVLDRMIAQARNYNIGHILMIIGQDFGHFDNGFHSTTKGTRLDYSGGSYHKAVTERCLLASQAVEQLAAIAPVTVLVVPGNHDREDSIWLGEYLAAWFKDTDHVTVDNSENPRKYFAWGPNLFGVTHGNEEKIADLPLLLAVEARSLWAYAEHCEFLTGHIHTRQTMVRAINEEKGILVRTMPSLVSPDSWHLLNGYVENWMGGVGMIYDMDHGKINEFPIPVKK